MESPAKRMRILQSLDVDEDNVEYIKAKQKQQQKFKSRLESIFDKFGNMSESQSDEIDFRTNKVVVDRGHLRRIGRHAHGKQKTLLDRIALSADNDTEDDDTEEPGQQDSEDELAPPQPVRYKTTGPPEQDTSPQPVISVASTPQIPNTPNPAADLLRNVQLPHTPAGLEAQSAAFYASLMQTINQAVHQFTAHLNTPNAPSTFASAPLTPVTSVTTNDKVAPATDPKWLFPPLSANPRQCLIAQSSPLPSHTALPTALETGHTDINSIDVGEERPTLAPYTRLGQSSPTRPRRSSPRVEIPRGSPQSARKYHFAHQDDVYISKRKRIHGASWAVIKDGMPKWRDWPTSALHNRWILIKDQNLHLQDPFVAPTGVHVECSDPVPVEQVHAIPEPPQYLPTPSSSEHEECHQAIAAPTEESDQNLPSSSTHYDGDERDLLSLAGSDSDDEELPTGNDDTFVVASQEVILPSIENRDSVDENTPLEDLPSTPQTQDFIMTPTRTSSVIVKTEPAFSSPLTLRERKRSLPIADVVPDSQDNEDDDVPDDSVPDDSSSIIVAPYQPSKSRSPHQSHPQTTHTISVRKRNTPLELVDVDELLALTMTTHPTTPSSKRKHRISTTPPTASRSYQTPKACNVDASSEAATAVKSTSQTGRKAFIKKVKREWTGKESAKKRKRLSLGAGVLEGRKRKGKEVDEGSEDELGKMFW